MKKILSSFVVIVCILLFIFGAISGVTQTVKNIRNNFSLGPIILLGIGLIIFAIYRLYKSYLANNLKTKLSKYNFSNNYDLLSPDAMLTHIFSIQADLKIEKQYQISHSPEANYVKEILKLFSEDLTEKYWQNKLVINYNHARLNDKEYFIFQLERFLSSNNNYLDSNGSFSYKLKKDLYNKKCIDYRDTQFSNWTYELTDISITYHKLLYICIRYCQYNQSINKILKPELYQRALSIAKDALDTKKVDVMVR